MGNCQNASDATAATPTSKSKGSSHIIVTTFTWARDSHGLFDYESKSLTKKAFKAQGTGVIRRTTNDIGFTKDNDKTAKLGDRDLLKLSLKQGNFWINACGEQDAKLNKEQTLAIDPGSLEQDPWLVIKSFKNNTNRGYKLNEGDLIKLGRVKYRIREIKGTPTISNQKNSPEKQAVNTEVDNNNSLEESFKKSPRVHKESQGNINNSCRICLSETCEPDNPFFSPCNCAGTMKLIHVKCLQTWLKSKLHMKTSGHTTFIYWKTLECELCKFPYPQCLEVDNKKYDIVEIERPDCAYIVLEVLSKEKNVTKGVHIIKMEGKSNIRLGRGHDSDIRITDISVSRCHAIIKLDKGNFYIEDNNSKFGTLLHLSKPMAITGDYNNLSVQIGRTVVTLMVKKGRGMFPICFGNSSNMNSSLNDKNSEGNGIFSDFNQNVPSSPASPLSALSNNRSVIPNAAQNRTISLNAHSRERNYLFDMSHSNSLPVQNVPIAVANPEPEPQVRPQVQEQQQNVNPPQEQAAQIDIRQPSLSENEGNVGPEADERSYYSPRNH